MIGFELVKVDTHIGITELHDRFGDDFSNRITFTLIAFKPVNRYKRISTISMRKATT